MPIGTQWNDMLNMPLGMLVGVIGLDPLWYRNIYHSEFGFESNNRARVAEEVPASLTVFNPHLVALQDYVNRY